MGADYPSLPVGRSDTLPARVCAFQWLHDMGQPVVDFGPISWTPPLENYAMHNTPLSWSEALSLDMPLMDTTHQEFVELLAGVVESPDSSLLSRWADLIQHTDAHFGQEDRWMVDTGFAAENCHSVQHKVVLDVMREGGKRGLTGELNVVRQMAYELGLWFPQHAQAMDASLALHLRSAGYDPTTGVISQPAAVPVEKIQGCGGSACGDADVPQAAEAAAA
jgi:hemerythrin-like metal-binding protein